MPHALPDANRLPGRLAEDDPHVTVAPFYFVLNQPFKALNEIGFIQGMADHNTETKAAEKAADLAKRSKWRAFYSYFSTIFSLPGVQSLLYQLKSLCSQEA